MDSSRSEYLKLILLKQLETHLGFYFSFVGAVNNTGVLCQFKCSHFCAVKNLRGVREAMKVINEE